MSVISKNEISYDVVPVVVGQIYVKNRLRKRDTSHRQHHVTMSKKTDKKPVKMTKKEEKPKKEQKKTLFDDEEEEEEIIKKPLKINQEYATRYEHNKKREDLMKGDRLSLDVLYRD